MDLCHEWFCRTSNAATMMQLGLIKLAEIGGAAASDLVCVFATLESCLPSPEQMSTIWLSQKGL